jgi:hypothetical protein
MKQIIISISLIFVYCIGMSQVKTISGTYYGGACRFSGECGNWYLRSDSVCLLIGFSKDSIIYTSGIGKWTTEPDNDIQIDFSDQSEITPSLTTIKYTAENRYSPDSVYYLGTTKFYKPLKDICEGQIKGDCFQGYVGINSKEGIPIRGGSFYTAKKRENVQKKITKVIFWGPFDSVGKRTGGGAKMNFLLSPNHNQDSNKKSKEK